MIVLCLYSVYKVPTLYWALKLRISLENHQNEMREKHSEYKHNQKNVVEKYDVNNGQAATGEVNKLVTLSNVTESEESKAGLKLRINVTRIEDETKRAVTTETSANIHHDIVVKEIVNSSVDNKTNEKEKLHDLQSDQFEDVLKEIKEEKPSNYNNMINEDEKFDGQFLYDSDDIEFDINDVSAFQRDSENLFKTFPNHQNATKYLIYYCADKCGGLGDRLKGISAVYMMSILTERRFAISMTTPCEIDNFLQPNLLDWKYPPIQDIIGKTIQTIDCDERHDAYEIDFQIYDPDPKMMMKADVVQMKATQDWTRIYRKMSVTPKRFPQMYQYHSSELLRTIFTGLFKLSPELKDLVDEFLSEHVNGKKLACLHARMGEEIYQRYTFREILIPLQFLKKFDSLENYKIMVATDNEKVKVIANHMFKNFVDTSGPILHIDYMANGSLTKDQKCAGFMRCMVDHAILQRCDQLILTRSGFGVTAASIRHTSRGLFVYMRGEAVMPTKRELIRETFQWRCLAPSWDMKYFRNICDT